MARTKQQPNGETFRPIASTEPIDRQTLSMIAGFLGPMQAAMLGLGMVDLAAGTGIIDGQTKCLWRTDGRRIEINMERGGVVASVSRGPDPEKPTN
jgi:hypothetical protein